MVDNDLYAAAELLVGGSNAHNLNDESNSDFNANQHNNSISSLEGTYLEELASGIRRNGWMSAVRRFFCCFVLFDLLLISLTWLICIMIMGGSILEVLKKQILQYSMSTSLFDIVLTSVSRFVILLLFYGVLQLNTTFFVAFTTFATCVFLICKVIYYSWTTASEPAFQVVIVLMSFIVAWLEAWFFDFRVIPQESFALQYSQSKERASESLSNLLLDRNLRNPVVRNFLRDVAGVVDEANGSTRNFYSPLESPNDSDNESDLQNTITKTLNNDLLSRGRDTADIAWKILNEQDWKLQKQTLDGDCIYYKNQNLLGKFFMLKSRINIPAEKLLRELFENVSQFPTWNHTILESRRVLIIDGHTDVTYQVSAPGGNGVISSRDFVDLRHWAQKGNSYILAGISIPYAPIPPTNLHTRGENGPCCWVMTPCEENPTYCTFKFLLNTNLKGWIPKRIVEPALISVLIEYSTSLKQHCQALL